MGYKFAVATGLAMALFAGPAIADATTSPLTWRPDDPAAVDESSLHAAPSTTVTAATLVDATATLIDFSGWRFATAGVPVSTTASMLSTDPDFASSSQGGADGYSTVFDPGSGPFRASVWVHPTPATAFPRGKLKVSKVSPNILQKGRSNSAGGYWKLSTVMVSTAVGLRWAPLCTFRSSAGVVLNVNFAPTGQYVMTDESIGYAIACGLNQGVATLTITPDSGLPETRSLASATPYVVANTAAVSVGHSPLSHLAADSYDGLLAGPELTQG